MIIYNKVLDNRARLVDHPSTYKIPCIDQWLGKYCTLGRNRAKQGVGKQVWFVPSIVRESEGSHNPRKILQFLPSFKLGNSISSF